MLHWNWIAAGVVAGLFALTASNASAQDKKPAPPDTVKALEAELTRLKAMEAELQTKLKRVQIEAERQRAIEGAERRRAEGDLLQDQVKRAQVEAQKLAQVELEKTLKLRADHLKLAQLEGGKAVVIGDDVKRGVIELQRGLVLKAGPDNPKATIVLSGLAGPAAYEKMSPQQLKELIVKLNKLLDEKTRHADHQKRGEFEDKEGRGEVKGREKRREVEEREERRDNDKDGRRKVEIERRVEVRPGTLKINPGQVSQEEILKRLDRLSKEVEELRRAIRK